jgi:Domain of unknown function (DUF4333)
MSEKRFLRPPMAVTVMAVAMAVILFAGSVATAGTPEVPKATVQSQAAKILAAKTGQKPPKVSCPSGVAAKVGAVIHCTVVPHGMTLKYPATVKVRSIRGNTAYFYVQVGQALGQGNRATFCTDNATITAALTAAKSPAAFLAALQANRQILLELQSSAPSKIVVPTGTLIAAARQAVQSGSIAIFNTASVAKADVAIDAFCGQVAAK